MIKINKRYVMAVVVVSLAMGVTVVAGLRNQSGTKAASYSVTPRQADNFVDSIGVNTHLNYGDRTYGNYPAWRDLLVASGVRNIRDSIARDQQYILDRYREMALSGIKVNLLMGRPWNGIFSSSLYVGDPYIGPAGSIDELHTILKNNLLGSVISVEGPNEVDIQGYPDWTTVTREYQTRLYNKIKNDTATRHLPVIGPSFVGGDASLRLGAVPCDYINLHNYTGGLMETSSHIDSEISTRQPTCPGKPAFSTESNPNTGTQADNQPGVSERAQGIYTLRQFAEAYRKGIVRSFIYELLDESNNISNNEMTWGIVRADFSPKPAYTALKNMIGLLSDKGTSFSPTALNYTLSGENSLTRQMLLQKRDGTYWLAIWQETSVYQGRRGNGGVDLNPANTPVTINLPQSASVINNYRPNVGSIPQGTVSNTAAYSFESSEEITLLEIKGLNNSVPTSTTPVQNSSDLVVTQISMDPVAPASGQNVRLYATVKNQGLSATPAGVIHGIEFRANGVQVGWSDTDTLSLAAGQSRIIAMNNGSDGNAYWTPTAAGSYTLRATVDDVNRIAETNETNNIFDMAVTVSAAQTVTVLGDVNGDSRVNALDLSLMLAKDGQNYPAADFDKNGIVGAADLAILLSKWTW